METKYAKGNRGFCYFGDGAACSVRCSSADRQLAIHMQIWGGRCYRDQQCSGGTVRRSRHQGKIKPLPGGYGQSLERIQSVRGLFLYTGCGKIR